ncbi:MAG: response regulator, partial [Rhodospirillales bacterium]|nr:response regulator [Rhodospirillales bacterium]
MKLLIIEDNPRLAALMARRLDEAGITVDLVASIEEAGAALGLSTYDGILLDLGLPDGDGSELLRRLRRGGSGTPVLVITARGAVSDRVALLDAGADDYLVKPFSTDELLARVRAVLRRHP